MTVVHNGMHTREQLLQVSIGLGLGLCICLDLAFCVCFFWFSSDYFVLVLFAFLCWG